MNLKKNINEEAVKILLQENKRLKRENHRLNESLGELQRYKDEYRSLIEELNLMKGAYADKAKGFDKLEKEYRKQLDAAVTEKKKHKD